MKKFSYCILFVIVISNLPLFDFFLQDTYTYSNIDGSFYYSEEGGKGKSYLGCQRVYGVFLCRHPEKDQADNRLFRTFTFKPWRFWEWRQMIFHSDRFLLPYLAPTANP